MKKDVVVIGAGIAGMTAALYLKRANKDVVLIEKGIPGGTINTASMVKNYPGIKSISGPDFANLMFEQILDNKIEFLNKTVVSIENLGDKKIVKLNDNEIECKYIVIATGKEVRKLDVVGERDLTGRGVSYCAICDGPFYRDKHVAVIGTGDSALEEALYLSNICSKVTILAKYDYFKCQEYLLNEVLKKDNIDILYSSVVDNFNGAERLESIDYKKDGVIKNIVVDGVFIYIGSTPNIFSSLSLELDGNFIKTNELMETSIKGIYAAGDIVKKSLYQLITAGSDGAIAATSIIKEMSVK